MNAKSNTMTSENPEERETGKEGRKEETGSGAITYRLHIKRGDREVDVQGDKDFVATRFHELKTQVFGDVGDLPGSPVTITTGEIRPAVGTTLSEFVRNLKAAQHTDIVLGMAYYLLMQQSQSSFTSGDIYQLYAESRLPKTNVNLAIIGNIRKGLVTERPDRKNGLKSFAITPSGEEYIEKLLTLKSG